MLKKFLVILSIAVFSLQGQNNITVFVHGTLFKPTDTIFHWLDCPKGFHKAQDVGKTYIVGKIPYILNQANPKEYPLDLFYLFGWSGTLCFNARKEAAHELYHKLKKLDGKITVIGQSHGCNVALNLAQIAKEHNDNKFKVERLILLAGPVQTVTKNCVKSSIFKKVYSLYSAEDYFQVGDPQGLYKETKKINSEPKLFSERIFDSCQNLIQARVLMNWHNPWHIDFILKRFLKHLPSMIDLLESADKVTNNHYFINIPPRSKPYLVSKKDLSLPWSIKRKRFAK